MKFSKTFSHKLLLLFLLFFLLEANSKVFTFRTLLHRKTTIMYQIHNTRGVCVLTLTKQNKYKQTKTGVVRVINLKRMNFGSVAIIWKEKK